VMSHGTVRWVGVWAKEIKMHLSSWRQIDPQYTGGIPRPQRTQNRGGGCVQRVTKVIGAATPLS
jgi:hypothetical protein